MLTILEEIGNQPPVPSVTANANPDNVGAIGNYLDTLAVAAENTVPRPVTAVWPSQSPEVASEVHSAYLGDKSPQQAMSDLEGRIQQFEDQA
jgi:ABC-type glycerol-3-phosphate transport system substrate-binding protein